MTDAVAQGGTDRAPPTGRNRLMQRLASRFAALVVVAITLGSAVFAAVSAVWLYTSSLEGAETTAQASLEAARPTLTSTLWKYDYAALRDLIGGLESIPEIGAIQVSTSDGETLGTAFDAATADFEMAIRETNFEGKELLIGQLSARLDRAAVQARIEHLLLVQGAIFIGLIIVIYLLVRWTFRRLVNTPLRGLTDFVLRPDLLTTGPELRISDGPGGGALEFQQLERAINDQLRDHRRDWQELEDYKASLEDKVAERTQQLEAAQDEIVRNEKLAALGALVAGVAHELNTPIGNGLTAASTASETVRAAERELAEGTLTKSRLEDTLASTREASDIITSTLGRARELVGNFKQVAVDRQSENRRQFALDEVIEETLATLQPSLKKTPYRVETDLTVGLSIDGYPGPLGQVITNLCDNAVRHGFDGRDSGRVLITSAATDDDQVRIQVRDDGQGIPDDHLKKIFEPFFTTKLGAGGSGLGMSIVHRLVTQVMGGRIDVESHPGEGSVFTIVLPVNAPTAAEPSDSTREE
ncbi:ATP-binding protein [Halomonas sabkhae]|uniref:sensor histidine kinase n=1 Tax=Halomonas sabkhae TaxID=626223 RepID=UPI0025B3E27A|nr:sensor histidine kinase [Halomonas sabkhae]MDN3525914.1 ATP-binding protein [Halomonas sabkhae]